MLSLSTSYITVIVTKLCQHLDTNIFVMTNKIFFPVSCHSISHTTIHFPTPIQVCNFAVLFNLLLISIYKQRRCIIEMHSLKIMFCVITIIRKIMI